MWVFNSQNVTPDVQRVNELARASGIPVATVTETLSPAGASFQAWQTGQLEALADGAARRDRAMSAARMPDRPRRHGRSRTPRIEAMGAARSAPAGPADAAAALADAGHRRGGAQDGDHRAARRAAAARCRPPRSSEQLQRRGREASRASIYRVMEELESIGLLARVEVGQGTARFEPARGAAGHHHHLVCERCGRLEPFSDDGLERAIERVSERLALEVSEHEIVLRGACRSCARAVSRRSGSAAAAARAAAGRRRAASGPSRARSRGRAAL